MIALISLPISPTIHRRFRQRPAVSAILPLPLFEGVPMPPYRYRIATARFPLFPPPPVYPRGAVIRRFAIGAILVAVFVFVWCCFSC